MSFLGRNTRMKKWGATAFAVAFYFGGAVFAFAADYPDFNDESVTARTEAIIEERSKDGVFPFHDRRTAQNLNLVYEKMRVIRGMKGYGWFANAIFHDKKDARKQYALDFWFKPQRDGDSLDLIDIRIQKGPRRDGDGYIMVTRLPVAWWWLPVQEHPGDTEVVRAWHVMSAIHNFIAANKNEDGALELKDEKTGETIPLEFVEMHQPVRYLQKEGHYFACTDFRRIGSKDEYYDIDFWVDETTGRLKVTDVKIHKVPVQEDGIWIQVPRYTFEGMDFEITH